MKPEIETMPYSYQMTSGFFIVHNTIDSTAQSNHLKHQDRPGFEPSTSEFHTTIDPDVPP